MVNKPSFHKISKGGGLFKFLKVGSPGHLSPLPHSRWAWQWQHCLKTFKFSIEIKICSLPSSYQVKQQQITKYLSRINFPSK